jgi:20S proteasome alpha/beta subunit
LTCIIGVAGKDGFICGDRRITAGGERCPNMVKVYANVGLVVGMCGNAGCFWQVARLIKEGRTDPKDLIEVIDEDSSALALTADGSLWGVSEGATWPVRQKQRAVGSGADLATGYLAALGSSDKKAVRAAQRFVAAQRTDCGGGCDFRTFVKGGGKVRNGKAK